MGAILLYQVATQVGGGAPGVSLSSLDVGTLVPPVPHMSLLLMCLQACCSHPSKSRCELTWLTSEVSFPIRESQA